MKKNKKINIEKKVPLIIVALVVLIGIGFYLFLARNGADKDKNLQSNTDSQQIESKEVNLNPPTQEDLQRVNDNKKSISDRQAIENNTSTNTASPTKPVITYAGQYGKNVEVGAYIDVFEDGGSCTATFSKGEKAITKSVQAIKGAKSVDCPVMQASVDELSSTGSWSVSVTYKSSRVSATSDSKTIEVK